jgi:predicted nucleic acid-binding protein
MAVFSCELVTSTAVLRELGRGRSDQVPKRIDFLRHLRQLEANDEVFATVAVYVQHRLMPRDPEGDALHLALASHHDCDVLATWNYHHLANRNKLDRIRRLNGELGLAVPRIVSPRHLLEGDT